MGSHIYMHSNLSIVTSSLKTSSSELPKVVDRWLDSQSSTMSFPISDSASHWTKDPNLHLHQLPTALQREQLVGVLQNCWSTPEHLSPPRPLIVLFLNLRAIPPRVP